MQSFQFILQYVKRHRLRYFAGIITLFVVDFANIFIPKLTGTITDGLASHTFAWTDVRSCLAAESHSPRAAFCGATSCSARRAPSKKSSATTCSRTSRK